MLISVKAHGSRVVAITAHHDCAGNPVSEAEHRAHLTKAVETVRSWNLPLQEVVGLWLGEDWKPKLIIKI